MLAFARTGAATECQCSPDAGETEEQVSRAIEVRFLMVVCLAGLGASCLGDMSVATHHFPAEDSSLGLRREHAHLYLAEYHRWLMTEAHGSEAECQLPMDTGGAVRANLYRTEPGAFMIQDRTGTYRANTIDPEGNCEQMVPPAGARFIGAFDVVSGEWSFVDAAVRPELPVQAEP